MNKQIFKQKILPILEIIIFNTLFVCGFITCVKHVQHSDKIVKTGISRAVALHYYPGRYATISVKMLDESNNPIRYLPARRLIAEGDTIIVEWRKNNRGEVHLNEILK